MGFLRSPPRPFVVAWDLALVVLAVASLVLIVQYEQSGPEGRRLIEWIDYAFVVVFLGDFAWDLYRAADRARFLRRNWWALLGMVPLAWTDFDYLRLLRVTRALRILRAFRGLAKVIGNAQTAMEKSQVGRLAVVSGSIMLVGSVVVWFVERGDNDRFAEYGEALWWAIVTVTTVGYGDITPQTTIGRIVASALMITGIGTIGLLAGQVGSHLVGSKERAAPATNLVAELEALAALHRRGDLSDAEYRQAKAKLLAGQTPPP